MYYYYYYPSAQFVLDDDEVQVRVKISFEKAIPSGYVVDILRTLDSAAESVIKQELDAIVMHFAPENVLALEQAAMLARSRRGTHFQLSGCSEGSIVLTGIVAGSVSLASWLIVNTAGETLKQAWQESEMHVTLKNFLKTRLRARPSRFREGIEQQGSHGMGLKVMEEGTGPATTEIIIMAQASSE